MKLADQVNPVPQDNPSVDPAPQAPTTVNTAQPNTTEPVAQQAVPQAPPQDASDRTKEQFEKLIESNKRLAEKLNEEITAREAAKTTFDPIQQVPQQPVPQQINPNDFIETNPVTGESIVNADKLNAAIKDANDRASKAESAVQNYIQTSEQREIERQNREAFDVYPELNPDTADNFNADFSKQTRAVIYDSLINPQDYGGRPLSFKEAADQVKTRMAPDTSLPTPEPQAGDTVANEPVVETDTAKEQASLAAAGQQPDSSRVPQDDAQAHQKLVEGTRYGDDLALAMRLKNTDHVGSPTGDDQT